MSQRKVFEIHPKRPISGILPNNKRISEVTKMPLSRAEFLRCMHSATVYAVVGRERVLVTETDYDKAMALFDKHVEYTNSTINLIDRVTLRREVVETKPTIEPESLKVEVVEEPAKEESKVEEKPAETEKEIVEETAPVEEPVEEKVTETVQPQQNNTSSVSVSSKKKNKNR